MKLNLAPTELIALNKGEAAIVDRELVPVLSRFEWRLTSDGYAVAFIDGRNVLMHRVVNETPEGVETDHINRNRLDNRRSNLRNATHSQNMQNRGKRSGTRSQYRGVILTRSRQMGLMWQARITANGKLHIIGNFKGEIEAAQAYDNACRALHGDFAQTNF